MFMSETSIMFSGWWLLACFLISPLFIWGFMIQFDEHLFQKGSINHQQVIQLFQFDLFSTNLFICNHQPRTGHNGRNIQVFLINRPESFGQSTLRKKRGEIFGRHSWAGRLGNLIGVEAWKLDISHGCILLAISHGRIPMDVLELGLANGGFLSFFAGNGTNPQRWLSFFFGEDVCRPRTCGKEPKS